MDRTTVLLIARLDGALAAAGFVLWRLWGEREEPYCHFRSPGYATRRGRSGTPGMQRFRWRRTERATGLAGHATAADGKGFRHGLSPWMREG
jgi:hypothetical protein